MSLNDLPGAEIILPGLSDLHSGNSNTVGALLIALAKPLCSRSVPFA